MGTLRDAMRDLDDAYTAGRRAGWESVCSGVPGEPPDDYSETELEAWYGGYEFGERLSQ